MMHLYSVGVVRISLQRVLMTVTDRGTTGLAFAPHENLCEERISISPPPLKKKKNACAPRRPRPARARKRCPFPLTSTPCSQRPNAALELAPRSGRPAARGAGATKKDKARGRGDDPRHCV